jgi:hypothetical protein
MRAVTVGLAFGSAAGAPPIGSGLDLLHEGKLLEYHRFIGRFVHRKSWIHFVFDRRNTFAATFKRSAFNRIKPVASSWL